MEVAQPIDARAHLIVLLGGKAGKALKDAQQFLPFKSYRPLDSAVGRGYAGGALRVLGLGGRAHRVPGRGRSRPSLCDPSGAAWAYGGAPRGSHEALASSHGRHDAHRLRQGSGTVRG